MSRLAVSRLHIPLTVCVAAIVLLSLSACAPTPAAAPAGTSSATTSATPAGAPAPLFGGDCAELLSLADVQAILGVSLPANPGLSYPSSREPFAVGGINCRWYLGEQGDLAGAELDATIVPSAVGLPADLASSTADSPRCDSSGCRLGAVTDGWWIEATTVVYASAGAQRQSLDRAGVKLRASIAGLTAPIVEPRSPLDCVAVDAAIAPGSTLGLGAFTVSTAPEPDPATIGGLSNLAAYREAGATVCQWNGASAELGFSVTMLPHSAGGYLGCASSPSATSVLVPDVAKAVTFPIVSGGALLCVSDGVSTVTTEAPPGGLSGPWTVDQLALVSKILAPALEVGSN